ncbi:GNAT family N-acetyltransferase [Phytohalomonas tamaricis]|uniref:GNAT family N-acetyltransferase n=1 Tax=Phytohalomonas tamaricis TaxID=2081032 RepID=UPI000D0AC682|nr:GNAT family protein [Phytohalomonas tamaricis]
MTALPPRHEFNAFDQPIGLEVPDWQGAAYPARVMLEGHFCRIEPLDTTRHGAALCTAMKEPGAERNWTYMLAGPFVSNEDYLAWLTQMACSSDPLFFAIIDTDSGDAVGVASYLRIDANNGVIEIGHLNFSPRLQRTPAATEAMYLLMKHAFALGYRRYEWKCHALNQPSCNAALRLGFRFEGIFRQAMVLKGRNRDTSWYSIIDSEWPACAAAFERWLAKDNFDTEGRQRHSLAALRAELTGREPR